MFGTIGFAHGNTASSFSISFNEEFQKILPSSTLPGHLTTRSLKQYILIITWSLYWCVYINWGVAFTDYLITVVMFRFYNFNMCSVNSPKTLWKAMNFKKQKSRMFNFFWWFWNFHIIRENIFYHQARSVPDY